MMETDNIIQEILTLPQKFNAVGNDKSIYILLEETGYFQFHNQIHEDAIASILIRNPDRIKEWLQWSEDKRSSGGWYFTALDLKYEIGKINSHGVKEQNLIFSDARNACAAYIKREVEKLRLI